MPCTFAAIAAITAIERLEDPLRLSRVDADALSTHRDLVRVRCSHRCDVRRARQAANT